MSRLRWGLLAALAALLVVLPFQSQVRPDAGGFSLAIRATSTEQGHLRIYADTGEGFIAAEVASADLAASEEPQELRLPLLQGDMRKLRIDPLDRDGTVTLLDVRVLDRAGRTLRDVPLSSFSVLEQVGSLRATPAGLTVVVPPTVEDAQIVAPLTPALDLHVPRMDLLRGWLRSAASVFAVLILLGALFSWSFGLRIAAGQLWEVLTQTPARSVIFASLAAVLLSSYPVALIGRSLVSPNLGAWLLYDEFPTLPGSHDSRTTDVKGSDVGALLWQQIPYSAIQHRSIFHDFELPLWNRDSAGGTPLLGQGQSMLGDPLHFLVIAADGASWAWDLKLLLAKFLLACGLGTCVWLLTRSRNAAMIVAAAAPFFGFFLYRINHPAIFSFCYAPWILVCWLGWAKESLPRALAWWGAGLILANWTELCSGTVKEAYVLLLTMNLAGLLVLALAPLPGSTRRRRLAILCGLGVLFVGLASPMWVTFLETLRTAYTTSDAPSASQIQPGLLLGSFDEAFYRPLSFGALVFNPSANFLVLAGVLYFLATLREQARDRRTLALAVGAVIPLGFAFGVVPPAWIERWPFFENLHHIDNCFSCAWILLAAVLAGAGFAAAERRLGTAEGRGDLWLAAAWLAALIATYLGFAQANHRSVQGPGITMSVYAAGRGLPIGGFTIGYLAALTVALVAFGLAARRGAQGRGSACTALVVAMAALALVWRGGEYTGGVSWPDVTFRPPPRVSFHARSGAVDFVRLSTRTEPARAVGLQGNLFPGWTGMYGIEGMGGPDALMNPYYRALTDASPLEHVWDWRLYVSRENLAASRPFLDLLNVRYYVDLRSDQAALGRVLKLDRPGDLDVYESRTAWPRAFFTAQVATYADPADLVRLASRWDRPFAAIERASASDSGTLGSNEAILSGSDHGGDPPSFHADRSTPATNPAPSALASLISSAAPGTAVPAADYRLTENSTAFTLRAPSAGLAVLTETFWSGYPHVQVDGATAHAIRVNHAFIGIPVTAGTHRILVRYRPRHFDLTLALAAASAFALALAFAIAWRKEPAVT